MSKEKETILNIIDLYKDMPYLWNKADKNYMNKNLRHEGFQVLLNVYKSFDEQATLKTLKKKIDNLKTNYQKEYKKVKASKHTGAGSEEVYVPSIWYYDSFSFLESTTESCRSVTQTEEDEDSSLSCLEDSQMTTTTTSTTKKNLFKKKKKDAPLKHQQDILEKAAGLINTKEEDWEILGKSIGMQLRDLNRQQHAIARKLISDVIFYGTLNKLNEESFVGVSITPGYNSRAASKSPYSQFTPLRSSSSKSEFNPYGQASSSPPRVQSPYPSSFTQTRTQSPDFPFPHQIQFSCPPSTTSYHSQSSNSPIHTLPSQQQIQPSHLSQSQFNIKFSHPTSIEQYHIQTMAEPLQSLPPYQAQSPNSLSSTQCNSQTANSPNVKYIVQIPQPSNPSPPLEPATPNEYQIEDALSLVEGNAEVMKDFLIFCKKK